MSENIITVYHGSDKIIEKPEYGKGHMYNDYGVGFYLTKEKDLAGEWAVLRSRCDQNSRGSLGSGQIG